MAALVQPCPGYSPVDFADVGLVDAEQSPDLALKHLSFQRANIAHLGFSEFGPASAFPPVSRAMNKGVGHILFWRLPSQVSSAHAPGMSSATGMRRVVLGSWRWPMLFLASKPRNQLAIQYPVATRALAVRPKQALVSLVRENNFAVKSMSLAALGSSVLTRSKIAVPVPSAIMHRAPSHRFSRLAAFRNRAYSMGSHISLLSGCIGKNPLGALARSAGSLCLPEIGGECHG